MGGGYDSQTRRFTAPSGTCLGASDGDSDEESATTYALEVLLRGSGQLWLGVYASSDDSIEHVGAVVYSGAARRLVKGDPAAFRSLCGDHFVAAIIHGTVVVGALEVGGGGGDDAYRWLTARRAFSTKREAAPFGELLNNFLEAFPASAKIWPDPTDLRSEAIEPAELIRRAQHVGDADADEIPRPYVALLARYPERLLSGLESRPRFDPPKSSASTLFGALKPRRSDKRDLLLARPHRVRPEASPASRSRPQNDAWVGVEIERIPAQRASVSGVAVYASDSVPLDLYFEYTDDHRHYWVPGAAAGTPRIRSAIAAARAEAPTTLTWVRRLSAGDRVAYMTDDPPAVGIHRERTGQGYLWIPGLASPGQKDQAFLGALLSHPALR